MEARGRPPLRFGLFELNSDVGELLRAGRRVHLQDQPLRILTLLAERPGELVTRGELRAALWPAGTYVDFDDGLNAAIKKLRAALGDSSENPRFIETVPRRGYRFIAPVTTAEIVPARAETSLRLTATKHRAWRPRRAAWAGLLGGAATAIAALSIPTSRPAPAADVPLDSPSIRSMAVLPLKNLSGDSDDQVFADGMTEELITRLASLEGVRVTSRTSAMRYKDTREPLPKVAADLGVDAVLEGSVLRAGRHLRVTTQLVLGASDRHLWAESYQADERDVLQLQDDIARDVAGAVRLKLRPAPGGGPTARPVDPEAHRAYLAGRARWHTRHTDGLLRAVEDFQRAISKDPGYAPAHAALADCYLVMPFHVGTGMTQEEAYPRARDAAARALALDPALAEAHNSSAYVRMYLDWDFDGAERGFRRAIDLNPSYATAHQWYAELLALEGRFDEAVAEIRLALALDPLAAVMHHQAGQTYQQAGRFDEAIDEYEAAHAIDSAFNGMFLSLAYWRQGRLGEAAEALKRGYHPDRRGLDQLASRLAAAARQGDTHAYGLRQLELAEFYPRPAYYRGLFHAALGHDAEALRWLRTAYERRDETVLYLRVDPEWERLRSDPRFVAILDQVGIGRTHPARVTRG